MSAGMRNPQERPRLEEEFSQVFVITLSAMKPGVYQVEDELAEERAFLPSASGPDPEKDVAFPDYRLCGLK